MEVQCMLDINFELNSGTADDNAINGVVLVFDNEPFRQGNKNNFAELNKRIELLEKKVKRLEMFNEALAKKAKEIYLNEKKKNSHNKKNN